MCVCAGGAVVGDTEVDNFDIHFSSSEEDLQLREGGREEGGEAATREGEGGNREGETREGDREGEGEGEGEGERESPAMVADGPVEGAVSDDPAVVVEEEQENK